MPEGHSVHRIARAFSQNFLGKTVEVSSPQGRFVEGARLIDGRRLVASRAVGKQMFLEFDNQLWLRVHLGLYGAWDFAGDFGPAVARPAAQRGTFLDRDDAEDSTASIGAPRRTRLRMSEGEAPSELDAPFPPPPIGAVRVRLLTGDMVADLRGPTACQVQSPQEVAVSISKLGPDPLVDDRAAGAERFVSVVRKKATSIGLLLMDQSVVSGIGNVYRAELLFRAGLNPRTPGKLVPEKVVRALWDDWCYLLEIGVATGQMLTMDGLTPAAQKRALNYRSDRHWVYHRAGLPCRSCGTTIALEVMGGRKLYHCPTEQA